MKIGTDVPSDPLQKVSGLLSSRRWLAAGLVLLTMAMYSPVGDNDFIEYDDADYVTTNMVVKRGLTWSGIIWAFQSRILGNWHPITWLSHMLDCTLFDVNPAAHHWMSVLGHAANAVLLFWLLARLTGAHWRSALVAALFAWHPLHVESVAWVSERKDILSTGFGLLALIYYHRFVRERSRGCYWAALALFGCSLLSKPMLVTLPFVLLLLDYWPWQRLAWARGRAADSSATSTGAGEPGPGLTIREAVVEKLPFFALAIASSVVTFWVQKEGGAVASVAALTLGVRIQNVVVSYAGYLGQMFWPKGLIIPYLLTNQETVTRAVVAAVVLMGITGLVWWFRRLRYLTFGWCFYLGTLVPVIGLVHVGEQAHADRYTYVPLIGIFVMLAWGTQELFSRLPRPRVSAAVCWGLALLACAPITWRQVRLWKNTGTLFEHTLTHEPNNRIALQLLGFAALQSGNSEQALEYFKKFNLAAVPSATSTLIIARALSDMNRPMDGIRLIETYRARSNAMTGKLWATLGELTESVGDRRRAYAEFQRAQEFKETRFAATLRLALMKAEDGDRAAAEAEYHKLLAESPDHPHALLGLAGVNSDQGKTDAARKLLQRALATPPFTFEDFYSFAVIQAKLGLTSEAERNYLNAIERNRLHFDSHYNLGNLYTRNGAVTNAVGFLNRAVQLRPYAPQARNNLGVALATAGRLQEAAGQYREAIRLAPTQPDAYYGLGRIMEMQTNYVGAAGQYSKVLDLSPGFLDARIGLALVLNQNGQWSNAVPQWEQVLKARPESGLGHYQLAVALLKLKRTAEAVPHLDRAVALRPNDRIAADTLARVLATSPEASLRNGARAVMLSEGICQPREQAPAAFLETLAAAYAETGAFDKARATAELALASARAAKDTTLAGRLQEQIALYQAGRPFRAGP
ncbi:O-GlcNAc transferase [Verrucomicrobiota bacterium]|nr:O-GlcNAc transferase [Verrucomicrobiota bacterium]